MEMLGWQEYLMLSSFVACVAGLLLLFSSQQTKADDIEDMDRMLMMMIFAYWMVHCLAMGVQKFDLPDWEILVRSVRVTAACAYFLTFACVLCLPLHRISVRETE